MARLFLIFMLAVLIGCQKSASNTADSSGPPRPGTGPRGGPSEEMLAEQAQQKAIKHIEQIGGTVKTKKTDGPGDAPIEVNLSGKTLTEGDLKEVGAVMHLHTLNLRGSSFPVAGLKGLSELRMISVLNLADCKEATDEAIKELIPIQSLETLSLAGTPVTDAGLKHLAALPLLVSLDLTGTKVTDAAVAELQKARPRCKVKK